MERNYSLGVIDQFINGYKICPTSAPTILANEMITYTHDPKQQENINTQWCSRWCNFTTATQALNTSCSQVNLFKKTDKRKNPQEA